MRLSKTWCWHHAPDFVGCFGLGRCSSPRIEGCAAPRVRLGARARERRCPSGAEVMGRGPHLPNRVPHWGLREEERRVTEKLYSRCPLGFGCAVFTLPFGPPSPTPIGDAATIGSLAEQCSSDKGGGPFVADGERAKARGGRIVGMRSDPSAPGFPRESSIVGTCEWASWPPRSEGGAQGRHPQSGG